MLRIGVVTDDVVRVADVAELAGLDPKATDAIGRLRITSAPPPGATATIKQRRLREVLREARVNLAAVSLAGVTRCKVSRPAETVAVDRPIGHGRSRVPTRGASRPAPTATQENVTLASAVRTYLRERLAAHGGEVNITFAEAVRDALGLSAPRFNFRIRPKSRRLLGLVSLAVEVREGRRVVQTVPVVAEVTLIKKVVVAKSAINRGVVIQSKHLSVTERTFSRVEELGESDPAAFTGNEADKFIPPGKMLRAKDVKPLNLIKRGDRVSVRLHRGRLVIETVAKARAAGSYGDVIEVMNEVSRRNYYVRVTGPGTAEVTNAPAGRLASLADGSLP